MHTSQRLLIVSAIAVLLLLVVAPVAIGRTGVAKAPTASVTAGRLNVRSGPNSTFSVVNTIERHENLPLVGRTTDGSWVQVRLPGDYVGWVDAQYVYSEADLQKLPITFDPASLPTQPRLTLSDGVVSPGKSITVLAEGFKGNQRVDAFIYSSEAGSRQKVGTGVADTAGELQMDLVMPSTWANGDTIAQSNVVLVVGAPEGPVNETANLQYVYGREAAEVPAVVDETFKALRQGDLTAARAHLTGAAANRIDVSEEKAFYNLTGVTEAPDQITGLGTRVVEVRGNRIKAETVLIFGDKYIRLASDLVQVQGNYMIQDTYVTGVYYVQDTAVVG